ncbi:MAG: hypothetical protein CSA49_03335 [Gammaproteobacteria bacterium]|nr:MAG: hypothetical protein CSA49_03335 [Gammaproteobacteria bacterium]
MNSKTVINFALNQLDNLGYELQRYGISNQVNRHNLAALAMTKQQQIKGEVACYELRLAIQRNRLEKAKQQALDTVDGVIEHLPEPIAHQVNRAIKLVA